MLAEANQSSSVFRFEESPRFINHLANKQTSEHENAVDFLAQYFEFTQRARAIGQLEDVHVHSAFQHSLVGNLLQHDIGISGKGTRLTLDNHNKTPAKIEYLSEVNGLGHSDNASCDEEDDEEHATMCRMFLKYTKNLIEGVGVSPAKIPKIFQMFGKRAVELLYPRSNNDEPGLNENNDLVFGNQTKKHDSKNGSLKIKVFIYDLLNNGDNDVLAWIDKSKKKFHFVDVVKASKMWGETKPQKEEKKEMNYPKMSRAMRYMYKTKQLRKIKNKKYTYQFLDA